MSPALAGRVLTTVPPGKSLKLTFKSKNKNGGFNIRSKRYDNTKDVEGGWRLLPRV